MRTLKALAVIGTRPEAIKMAPVIQAFRASGWIQPIVVATAQHREMLDQALGYFQLAVDHDLNVMTDGQSLASVTAKCVAGLDVVIGAENPDLVIAQGDTTTTFCAALAAF
jgi:UDP-N-acetylglucosamine 2-epimerase (non-hydrolysing)